MILTYLLINMFVFTVLYIFKPSIYAISCEISKNIYYPKVKLEIESNFYRCEREVLYLKNPVIKNGQIHIKVESYIHYLWLCLLIQTNWIFDLFGIPNVV